MTDVVAHGHSSITQETNDSFDWSSVGKKKRFVVDNLWQQSQLLLYIVALRSLILFRRDCCTRSLRVIYSIIKGYCVDGNLYGICPYELQHPKKTKQQQTSQTLIYRERKDATKEDGTRKYQIEQGNQICRISKAKDCGKKETTQQGSQGLHHQGKEEGKQRRSRRKRNYQGY